MTDKRHHYKNNALIIFNHQKFLKLKNSNAFYRNELIKYLGLKNIISVTN